MDTTYVSPIQHPKIQTCLQNVIVISLKEEKNTQRSRRKHSTILIIHTHKQNHAYMNSSL